MDELQRAANENYRIVREFDFDERPLGNFEDTPMRWERLRGLGLPAFARAVLDDEVGYGAPPSFRLGIETGNVAFEYAVNDLTVVPQSQYLLVGHIRAVGLAHSRAFLAAYLVDRLGERIPGSERVSDLVHSTGADVEPWQRVSLELTTDAPTAYALRIQVWLLQSYVWRPVSGGELDPIIRRDVHADAWFDDLRVFRLPRARLSFSNPGGLIAPGAEEEFRLEVSATTTQQLSADLTLTDADGVVVHQQQIPIPDARQVGARPDVSHRHGGARLADDAPSVSQLASFAVEARARVPSLPAGMYEARVRLRGADDALLDRRMRIAVLPDLGPPPDRLPRYGVNLGRWPALGTSDGAQALVLHLGCGSVKIGVEAVSSEQAQRINEDLAEVSRLVGVLSEARVDPVAVILPPADAGPDSAATSRYVRETPAWRERFGPVFAHFGGLLPAWQLGAESSELADSKSWDGALLEDLRRYMLRYVSLPRLVVPRDALEDVPDSEFDASILAPASVPARGLPALLDFMLQDPGGGRRWLAIETPPEGELTPRWRAIDAARRIILASALADDRVFVDAPFEHATFGGEGAWQPTELYIPLRTVFHMLNGMRCVRALQPEPSTVALLFRGTGDACLVIWTWRAEPLSNPVELYLGENARATDLFGAPVELELDRGPTRVLARPVPIFIRGVDSELTELQSSYTFEPRHVEASADGEQPTLTFENPYDTPLQGEIRVTPPSAWSVEPTAIRFSLAPGQRFQQPMQFRPPPREVAGDYEVRMEFRLDAPTPARLTFREPVSLGLSGIRADTHAYWQGGDLVVEQQIRNLTQKALSFLAYCEAPGRARAERMFIDIQPGEAQTQFYLYKDAADLRGSILQAGLEEVREHRGLNQLVVVPN